MIKKSSIRRICVATLALFILLIIYFFPIKDFKTTKNLHYIKENEMPIFLKDTNNYVARTTIIKKSDSTINQVKEIISYLTKNSSNSNYIQEGFKPLIPENTKIIDLNLDDGTLTINFTKELINIDKENEEDMLEAIIYSILEIKEIKNIKINIEGNPLVYLPNSKIKLPDTFDKTYGINKLYNIDSYKNTTKTTIYYLSKHNDLYYYVPITKIENSDKEKIEIIIKELKSTPIYHTNLISYLASSTNLTNYEILENNIKLSFNNNLIANINNNEMTETVKYSIALSIRDTYGYSDISFKILDNPEINITI